MPKSNLNLENTNQRQTYSSINELANDITEANIKNLAGVVMPNASMLAFASESMRSDRARLNNQMHGFPHF